MITALDDFSKILKILKLDEDNDYGFKIVNLKWLIDCNKDNCNINANSYFIERQKVNNINGEKANDLFVLDYECQRATKLKHFNNVFTVQ